MLAWLTPAAVPAETRHVTLAIPDSPEWLAALRGALLLLADSANWESHGAVTPEDTALRWWAVWESLADNNGNGVSSMVGSILWFSVPTLPDNLLWCNGAEIAIAEYPELYAVIGDTFDRDAPTGYFNVPSLESELIAAASYSGAMYQTFNLQSYSSGTPRPVIRFAPAIVAR